MEKAGQMNATIYSLLDQAKTILELRKQRKERPGERFNVFTVLNMETDEVNTHSRLLYEFLRPDGSHGMGDQFLRIFFQVVLKKDYPLDGSVQVSREKIASAGGEDLGRIDLLLEGSHFCYPIEVKIYAVDQDRQVERYMKYAHSRKPDGAATVFYLTLDGHSPSKESMGDCTQDSIVYLSFESEILEWLKQCGEIAWQAPSISAIIQQYISLLEKLTGTKQEDEFMMLIQNMIQSSQSNYENAAAIAEGLVDARIAMMQKVFADVEKHVGDRLVQLGQDYKENAEKYYRGSKNERPHPSLTYLLTKFDDLTIALRFEIDWKFFCGLVFYQKDLDPKPKQFPHQLIDVSERTEWKALISGLKEQSSWWIDWVHLPGEKRDHLNFKLCDGIYPSLYDAHSYQTIMNHIYDEVDQYMEKLVQYGLIAP